MTNLRSYLPSPLKTESAEGSDCCQNNHREIIRITEIIRERHFRNSGMGKYTECTEVARMSTVKAWVVTMFLMLSTTHRLFSVMLTTTRDLYHSILLSEQERKLSAFIFYCSWKQLSTNWVVASDEHIAFLCVLWIAEGGSGPSLCCVWSSPHPQLLVSPTTFEAGMVALHHPVSQLSHFLYHLHPQAPVFTPTREMQPLLRMHSLHRQE